MFTPLKNVRTTRLFAVMNRVCADAGLHEEIFTPFTANPTGL